MKTITTPHLLKFALTASLLTIAFRYLLSLGIDHNSIVIVNLSAIIYALTMFLGGLYFGKKDKDYLPIFDLGFRFHIITYLIHNGLSILWIGLDLGSKNEKMNTVIMTSLYWGIFILIHFIFYLVAARKNSINNLDKEDLFE